MSPDKVCDNSWSLCSNTCDRVVACRNATLVSPCCSCSTRRRAVALTTASRNGGNSAWASRSPVDSLLYDASALTTTRASCAAAYYTHSARTQNSISIAQSYCADTSMLYVLRQDVYNPFLRCSVNIAKVAVRASSPGRPPSSTTAVRASLLFEFLAVAIELLTTCATGPE